MKKEKKTMHDIITGDACRTEIQETSGYRKELPGLIQNILDSVEDESCFAHIGDEPIHFTTSVREMIEKFRQVIFPGYFSTECHKGRIKDSFIFVYL